MGNHRHHGGDVDVLRAPDFASSGEYLVRFEGQEHRIYRDPSSRDWYEVQPLKHYTECWLGSTKDEAVSRIVTKYEK